MITISTKICKQCKEEKCLSEFYTQNKTKSNGTEYIYYNPRCKKCCSENALRWGKENHDKKLEHYKTYNSKPHRRKATYYHMKKQRENGNYLKWQRENKDKVKEYRYKRMNKDHDITEEEWEACKKFFGYACAYCGISESESIELYGQKLHKDHFHHTGSNEIDNCIPACKACNSSKNDHDFYEWFQRSDIFDLDKFEIIDGWLSIFE